MPRVDISSVARDDAYQGSPQRIFVFLHGGPGNEIIARGFNKTFAGSMESCGIAVQSNADARDALSPKDKQRIKDLLYTEQQKIFKQTDADLVAKFHPDTMLDIRELGVRQRVFYRFTKPTGAKVLGYRYNFALSDTASQKQIWQAQIDLDLGTGNGASDAPTDTTPDGPLVAREVLSKMKKDGLLQSCPADE